MFEIQRNGENRMTVVPEGFNPATMPDKPEPVECEIYLAMNEDGGWIVTADDSEASEKLAEDEGGYACKIVKVTVKMTPPVIEEVAVEVPEGAGKTEVFPEARG